MATRTPKPYHVMISSVGNPDFNERPGYTCQPFKVRCTSIADASRICQQYTRGMGSGNWSGGQVYLGKEQVAQISYNGRAWKPGQEAREEIVF